MSLEADEWDDSRDAPFVATGVKAHLTRLRETYLFLVDGNLIGWSDQDIADRAGMTRAYVSRIMAGQSENLGMVKLVGLANAFDVTPLYFFSASARRRVNRRLDARLEHLRKQQLFGSTAQEEDAREAE
ncbi:helix-turn-helix domain-containing protein [Luteipulveratus halotolerans]|uniref:HTH cro/C1-type domain-containing protein n=1 Tax=Luteipulveratus halotolerans TaxID=1631356 RepID=A0A0L6CPM1_9MICO|nr:helix-turn-helix domain-containing protein [Luteipulveratus halotolerans]KNX39692.1 hypothetical protein VV01_00190 [Luteipulveratus halotolerans]